MHDIRRIKALDILEADNSEYILRLYKEESKGALLPEILTDNIMYESLEDIDMFHCVGLYIDEVLVGFITLLISKMPHYSRMSATIESFFVLPECRKHGAGKKLMKEALKIADEKDSCVMFMSAPINGRLDKVASSFGFKESNIVYTRKM